MIEFTGIQFDILAYAALGAFVHWINAQFGDSFTERFQSFFSEFQNLSTAFRLLSQITVFVILGAVISVTITDPTTHKQALTGGIAWTTLLGRVAVSSRRGGQGGKVASK